MKHGEVPEEGTVRIEVPEEGTELQELLLKQD